MNDPDAGEGQRLGTETAASTAAGSTHVLTRYDDPLMVVRLDPGADVPPWASATTLLSVTATAKETSLVCRSARIPAKAAANLRTEGPFVAFEVAGPLEFALTGVLATLLAPLAEAGVPVFVLSTFDTDWVLVRQSDAAAAGKAWRRSGHEVVSSTPSDS